MMARENIQPYAERERHRTEQQPEALCGVRREQHRRRAENAAGGIEHGNRLLLRESQREQPVVDVAAVGVERSRP